MHHAAPANSLLEMLAASELPAAGSKAAEGSRFQSMLKAATEEGDTPTLTAATVPTSAPGGSLLRTRPASSSRPRSMPQAAVAAGDRPKAEPSKNGSAADSAEPAADPVTPQRTPAPPITLNTSLAGGAPDEKDEEGSEVTNGQSATDASARTLEAAAEVAASPHWQPAPQAAASKSAKAADITSAEGVPVPPEQSAAPAVMLSILAASDAPGNNTGDASKGPSATDRKPAFVRIADASAELRTESRATQRSQSNQQSATRIQPDLDRPLTVSASPADGSLSKINPAFELLLQPASQEPPEPIATATASGKPETSRPAKDAPESSGAAIGAPPETAPSVAPVTSSSSKQGDSSRHPAEERPQETAIAAAPPVASAEMAQINSDLNVLAPPAPSTVSAASTTSRTETPAEGPPPTATPQTAATPPATHDIKLELNGGGQRVEVRLTDRGGDIHVAVRTPDARLSDAMRDDLPALAAKLEQSGFRTDALQAGATAAERRPSETGTGNTSQDSQEHAGQNQQQKQDNPQEQQPKNLTNAQNRKSDRKDFAWLLQTYR